MADSIDLDRIEKLPKACRFFDVNTLWYFPNRWAVRLLYPLPVSANTITWIALVMGLVSAAFYVSGIKTALVWGAVFLYGKLFLDNVDGSLARLRGEESRLGRFLDSFSDFVVSVLVYGAITFRLAEASSHPGFIWVLGGLALVSSLLQCSYWVYYYVGYTDWVGSYEKNRMDESVTERDLRRVEAGEMSATIYFLQRFHNMAYGWQDSLIATLDRFSRKVAGCQESDEHRERWVADKTFLTRMGPLCVCTNTMALVVLSLLNQLELFLVLVVFLGNGYLLALQGWKIVRFKNFVTLSH
ncbi:MAG: CDP-alcohol phosphatidyltransferase family protein [Nitrospinota bacterium]|nr:CDP-alcohol phosphatidyltransferase family protein [Nitrospinota bacterium]